MNNNNYGSKKTIRCMCALLVLFILATNAIASEQTKADSPAKPTKQLDRPLRPSESLDFHSMDARYDRRAVEAYKKRNAQITPRTKDNAPPKQGNAALLYYQAFLLQPESGESYKYKIYSGTRPDVRTKAYLGRCLSVIEIAETASRMPQCTWAAWPEPMLSEVVIRRKLGVILRILVVDAKTLAVDGHYRVALERCLTIRRIAKHFSEDPQLYLLSIMADDYALRAIKHVLGVIPPDEDILTWFRGRLSATQGAPMLFAKELKTRIVEVELNNIRTNPAYLAWLKDMLVKLTENEKAKENIRSLTDEQFLLRTSEVYQSLLDSILRIADSEMTYEQKRTEMQKLFSKLMEADDNDPLFKGLLTLKNTETVIDFRHQFHLEHQAHINAVKAAVELYLVVAKTGRLPAETLPSGLPKDPSTNEDFIYEITDDGFILRCGIKNLRSRKFEQYEFKVKTKN